MVNALPVHSSHHTMMLVGAVVAECASLGLQGMSQEDVRQIQQGKTDGEIDSVAFYNSSQDQVSPYEAFVGCYQTSIVSNGCVLPDDIGNRLFDTFSATGGETGTNGLCEAFVAARAGGANWTECSQDNDTFSHSLLVVPTLVARFAGRHMLSKAIKMATQVIQRSEAAEAACGLLGKLLERCALVKCQPASSLEYYADLGAGGRFLAENEKYLLSSAMSDTVLARMQDIYDIVNMHPSLEGTAMDSTGRLEAREIARRLSSALICGGGGQGGTAAILFDNAELSSAQRSFWAEAKQAANNSQRESADTTEYSINAGCSLFGTGSEVTSKMADVQCHSI